MIRDWYGKAKREYAERRELRKYKPKKKITIEGGGQGYFGVPQRSKKQQQKEVDAAVREWKRKKRAEETAEVGALAREEKARQKRKRRATRRRKRQFRKVWRRLI